MCIIYTKRRQCFNPPIVSVFAKRKKTKLPVLVIEAVDDKTGINDKNSQGLPKGLSK